MNDLGLKSRFVASMPKLRLLPGRCPGCGGWHIFVFVDGNHPERGPSGNSYAVEPVPEDSARGPR